MSTYKNTKSENRKEFGEKIRAARKSANLSQSELAEAIGVSDRAISSYEKGRNLPPVEKLQKIANHTNYSLRFFVGEDDPMVSVQRILANIESQLAEVKEILDSQTDPKPSK